MSDYFSLLDEPRLPWLEPDELKEKFVRISSSVHPDRFHSAAETERQAATQSYTELNAAYACLRETKERLLHLLEIETGAKPEDIQRIPSGTMDLFVEVGQLCQGVDKFLAERAGATSPMLKVSMFERALDWLEKVNRLQARIHQKRDELEDELKKLNRVWQSAPPAATPGRVNSLPLERLEELYRLSSFISRWSGQLQERAVQLAL